MVSPHLTQKTHKLRNGAKDSSPVSDACTFHHTACGLSYMAGGQGPGGPCESSSTPRGGGGGVSLRSPSTREWRVWMSRLDSKFSEPPPPPHANRSSNKQHSPSAVRARKI